MPAPADRLKRRITRRKSEQPVPAPESEGPEPIVITDLSGDVIRVIYPSPED